jgi:hypothetical protein
LTLPSDVIDSNQDMLTLIKRIVLYTIKTLITLVLAVVLLVLFLYAGGTVYDFPVTKPFVGEKIFNPYDSLPGTKFKANFHAHSYSWYGITHGANTDKELYEAYTEKSYDIASISNYHKISNYHEKLTALYVPGYEHGFNIKKAHNLAINARSVSYWDFPLWQSISHQQTIIDVLRGNAEMVAIAHPKFGGGRSFEAMETLVGYHFTEVLNHYRNSQEYWDKALSAGKLSWITGNDDIHDLKDPEIFRIWNIIYADGSNRDSLLTNMKNGQNYAVETLNGESENSFVSCTQDTNGSFLFKFDQVADTIVFIGQNGIIKQKNEATNSASYTFKPDDTYIRVVAKNKNSNIYLNPLVRYSGDKIIKAVDIKAENSILYTWVIRLFIISVMLLLMYLWKRVLF